VADEVLARALAELDGDEPSASFVHATRGVVARESELGRGEGRVQVVEIVRKQEERKMNGHRWSVGLAAVAAATILGIGIANVTSDGDDADVETDTADTAPVTTAPERAGGVTDLPPDEDLVTPGAYRIPLAQWFPVPDEDWGITFEVPAGWGSYDAMALVDPSRTADDRFTAVGVWVVDNVYADPCDWAFNFREPALGGSADELVEALASDSAATGPARPTTFGGHPAWALTLVGPHDTEACDAGEHSLWYSRNAHERFHLPAGHTLDVLVVDADDRPIVITTYRGPDAPQDRIDQMAAIVASMRFDR
jgi:hypothetical protein